MKNKITKMAVVAVATIAFTTSSRAIPATVAVGVVGHAAKASTSMQASAHGNPVPVNLPQGRSTQQVSAPVATSDPANFFQEPASSANTSTTTHQLPPAHAGGPGSRSLGLVGSVNTHGPSPATTSFDSIFTTSDSTGASSTVFKPSSSAPMGSVPDGGYTAFLLGASMAGLAMIKRKSILRLA